MTTLPLEFKERMKKLLNDEYSDFLESYEQDPKPGLRVNTLKLMPQLLEKKFPLFLEHVHWTSNGYYYPLQERPAKHPYYQCGLYYLQEPSAMTPASLLPVEPGDYVLDLCAAPGGKATELGAKLQGKGLLVANDISNSRAKALLRNIELFGITNALITNETPEKLSKRFPEFFQKILVDAPCSGEGMFRKESAVAEAWTPDKPDTCAAMQREIVRKAISMLAPGGLLLYSTCTFAPIENEGTVSYILDNFPEMQLEELPNIDSFDSGIPAWGNQNPDLAKTIRIWPHHAKGEGHFIALFKKQGTLISPVHSSSNGKLDKNQRTLLGDFFKDILRELPWERVEVRKDKVYLLPPVELDLRGINFLRSGLYMGDMKKNRFEPSQQLALALLPNEYKHIVNLSPEDERITRYLRGETLLLDEKEATTPKGWQLLCVDSYPLGWGKLVNGILKNKYPAGWRIN